MFASIKLLLTINLLSGGDMKKTHRATNKISGEVVYVTHNKETGKYRENWMVQLIEEAWDIETIQPKEHHESQN
jgi:hypothetical protein